MIELKAEPYCHNCDGFIPHVDVQRLYGNNELLTVNTIVTCAFAHRCSGIKTFIETCDGNASRKENDHA